MTAWEYDPPREDPLGVHELAHVSTLSACRGVAYVSSIPSCDERRMGERAPLDRRLCVCAFARIRIESSRHVTDVERHPPNEVDVSQGSIVIVAMSVATRD